MPPNPWFLKPILCYLQLRDAVAYIDNPWFLTPNPWLLKMRLDKYLVDQGLCSSRERAQDAIKLKTVSVNGKIETKASKDIADTDVVELIDIFNK